MRKILIAAALVFSMPGCAGFNPLAAPAPLAQTAIDDKALETSWKAFDAALDAITILVDRNILKPGSPQAKTVANAIRKVNTALATAERFAAAGSSTSYVTAINEALAGIAEIRKALGSI